MTPEREVQISLEDYEKAGRFKDAINQEAEAVLARFPDEQKAIEAVFQRITEKGGGEKPIRKPETLPVLAQIAGLDPARLREIVDAFAARDLLVLRESEKEEVQV